MPSQEIARKEEQGRQKKAQQEGKVSSQKRGSWKKNREDRGLYKRGRTWYVRYAGQNGVLQYERVGPSKAVAMKVYQKRKTEVAEGRFFPETLRRSVKFDRLADVAFERAKQDHQKTRPGKFFRGGRYKIVSEWFRGRAAASITAQEIAEKLDEHCKAPATHNRYRVTFSHIYKLAIEDKKLTENPARLVKLKKENNERVRFLEAEEEQALRAVIRMRWPDREPEFDVALQTGMRWSEQYGLRWKDVDLKRGIIVIRLPKSGKDERLNIGSAACATLDKLRALAPSSEFVCPDINEWHHRKFWTAALTAAKITDFHWHDLRHTFASRLVMNGVDIYTVSKLMRHETLNVTKRYAHLAAAHLRDAADRFSGVTLSVTAPAEAAMPTSRSIH
jgi:site-specific recombinase XerD